MELNLDNPVNTNQVLNQVESVLKDVSNVKEKHLYTNQEYEKIIVFLDQLQSKTKELKHQSNYLKNDLDDSVDFQKHNLSINDSNKKIEQYKVVIEQLKKGKLSYQVSYY